MPSFASIGTSSPIEMSPPPSTSNASNTARSSSRVAGAARPRPVAEKKRSRSSVRSATPSASWTTSAALLCSEIATATNRSESGNASTAVVAPGSAGATQLAYGCFRKVPVPHCPNLFRPHARMFPCEVSTSDVEKPHATAVALIPALARSSIAVGSAASAAIVSPLQCPSPHESTPPSSVRSSA